MRHSIWLLALVVLAGLACAKEKVSETRPAAEAPTKSYTVKVTFEGLVGYVNTSDGVWALLPTTKLPTATDPAGILPPNTRNDPANYPAHYAVLKVFGKNVQGGLDQRVILQLPIDGYELKLPDSLLGTGSGRLDPGVFRQAPSDIEVDRLESTMLMKSLSSDAKKYLTARMKLPRNGTFGTESAGSFLQTAPVKEASPSHYCGFGGGGGTGTTRVELVTWSSPKLNADTDPDLILTLDPKLWSNRGASTLHLHPAAREDVVEIMIMNKVAESIMNPDFHPAHWAAYRWFYNLTTPPYRDGDCTMHYYPMGLQGGDRCPQKLLCTGKRGDPCY